MIEDALDHLVDGPRTSPELMRRLVIRAFGPNVPRYAAQQAIELFEYTYELAFVDLPDGPLNGGKRGQLLVIEATARSEWQKVREVLTRLDQCNHKPRDVDWNDTLCVPGLEPIDDEPILMLEPPESIERRERRQRVLRTVGYRLGLALLPLLWAAVVMSLLFSNS